MIAAAKGNGGDDDERRDDSGSDSKGGYIGVVPQSVADSSHPLTDRRIQRNAQRLEALVEAGAIAAERLPKVLDQCQKLMGSKRIRPRDFAALGKLQLAIATAMDAKQGSEIHVHGNAAVQIVHVDDWYGSKAANLAAADAASIAGASQSQAIQAPSLRPAVGENGGGAHSDN